MTDFWDYVFWYCVMVGAFALLLWSNRKPDDSRSDPNHRCIDCDSDSFLDK